MDFWRENLEKRRTTTQRTTTQRTTTQRTTQRTAQRTTTQADGAAENDEEDTASL